MGKNDEHKSHTRKHRVREHERAHTQEHKTKESADVWSVTNISLLVVVALLLVFNQVEIGLAANKVGSTGTSRSAVTQNLAAGTADLSAVTSTAQTLAAVFPLNQIQSTQDAIDMIIPTGTPEYSDAFGGISFDDPVGSLGKLAQIG